MSDLSEYFYAPDFNRFVGNTRIPDITEEYNPDKEYPSVVDRFFTKFYNHRPERKNEDHLILFHSNRICLIFLAPSHEAFQKGITSVTYDVGNCDRSKNTVSGKAKRGGMELQPGTVLALVKCQDGTEYKIVSCITGRLIEVNPRIVEDPSRLKKEGEGFVGVVLPKIEMVDKVKASLLTEEQYREIKNVENL
ncbi:Protein Abitram [Sergentomyia squamirostris]